MHRRLVMLLVGLSIIVGAGFGVATASSPGRPLDEREIAGLARKMPLKTTFVGRAVAELDGRKWVLGRSLNAAGERCLELRSPSGWRSGTCLSESQEFAQGPILAYTGGAGEVSFLHGMVSSGIERVEIVNADCSRQALDLSSDGFFVDVVSGSVPAPWQIRGLDSDGEIVSVKTLRGRGAESPISGSC